MEQRKAHKRHRPACYHRVHPTEGNSATQWAGPLLHPLPTSRSLPHKLFTQTILGGRLGHTWGGKWHWELLTNSEQPVTSQQPLILVFSSPTPASPGYVAQAGLKFNPPASASQTAGITAAHHCIILQSHISQGKLLV